MRTVQTSSMYQDLVGANPIEADQIIGDLLKRASEKGIVSPETTDAFPAMS